MLAHLSANPILGKDVKAESFHCNSHVIVSSRPACEYVPETSATVNVSTFIINIA